MKDSDIQIVYRLDTKIVFKWVCSERIWFWKHIEIRVFVQGSEIKWKNFPFCLYKQLLTLIFWNFFNLSLIWWSGQNESKVNTYLLEFIPLRLCQSTVNWMKLRIWKYFFKKLSFSYLTLSRGVVEFYLSFLYCDL